MLKEVFQNLNELLYPKVCHTCQSRLTGSNHHLCDWCSEHIFPLANPDYNQSCGIDFLPEKIIFQHALWKFDKGGYLQELLHSLKYHNLPGVGVDMGKALGKSLLKHPMISDFENTRLVPVPLHPQKEQSRGYNQARAIAEGISDVTGFEIIKPKTVIRRKQTKTQTGFNLSQRQQNVSQAFFVAELYSVTITPLIIVDDVFTTGATVFELASTVSRFSAFPIAIATIATA